MAPDNSAEAPVGEGNDSAPLAPSAGRVSTGRPESASRQTVDSANKRSAGLPSERPSWGQHPAEIKLPSSPHKPAPAPEKLRFDFPTHLTANTKNRHLHTRSAESVRALRGLPPPRLTVRVWQGTLPRALAARECL